MGDQIVKKGSQVSLGGDPEAFIMCGGKIIGSERAIPEEGLHVSPGCTIIRDGVQLELNLPPSPTPSILCEDLRRSFARLRNHLVSQSDRNFEVSFIEVVDVDPEELKALTPLSRTLGCAISFNWYDHKATIGVDPSTYTKRSAGGHIHLGLPDHIIAERDRLPPILDVLVGNTSVLIDRDKRAAERREVYGRAGEFRMPRHGLEYRTLSNFWLRAAPLTHLMLGLSQLAVWVLETSLTDDEVGSRAGNASWPAEKTLLESVKLENIRRAIDQNDAILARENFEDVAKFLIHHVPNLPEGGLDATSLGGFDYFVQQIERHSLDYWFMQDPVDYWTGAGTLQDWRGFLRTQVVPELSMAGVH